MTEAQARAALRAFVAVGEIEQWNAEQRWGPAPGGGWTVPADLHSWRFRIEPLPGGVRVVMHVGGGEPVERTVRA